MGVGVYIGHKHLPSTWHPPFFNLTLSFFPLQLLPFSSPTLFIGDAAEPSGPPALRASELWLRTKREEPLFFVLPSGRCLPRGGETWWSRYERHSGQWQNAAFVSGHTRSLYLCLYKQVLPSVAASPKHKEDIKPEAECFPAFKCDGAETPDWSQQTHSDRLGSIRRVGRPIRWNHTETSFNMKTTENHHSSTFITI